MLKSFTHDVGGTSETGDATLPYVQRRACSND
jgi:hypothetical protein